MTLLHRNDRRGAHAPSWYAETAHPLPEQPPLQGETRADVCIIGGGITGLSSALHLAERGVDVALVEAHRAGWGASGRNGGQVGVGQRIEQPELEARVGRDAARDAWKIGLDAAQLVRDLIERHQIDCAYKPGVMHVNHRARHDAHSRAHVAHMREVYGYDGLDFLTRDQVAERLGAVGCFGGELDRNAGHLHPLNFSRGLARAALAAGARIFEMTEATGVDGTNVATEAGLVKADTVILACNGYLGGLAAEVAARVMPINNFVLATEALPEDRARSLIRDDVAVADSRFVVNYYRLSEDRRLLFGGGESYGDVFPRDIKAFVRKRMLKVFPQLGDVKITHGWGGTLAITLTRLPVFAEIRAGVINASGYSGSGVALAAMAGPILAEALQGERARFDAMAALPAPRFPGGAALRRPTLIAAMLLARLRDAL